MKKVSLSNFEIELVIEQIVEIKKEKVKIDGLASYYILKNLKILENNIEVFKNIKNELISKHGVETEGGMLTISPEIGNWEEYVNEITPLLQDKVELELYTITPDKLVGGALTIDNMIALDFMVEE